LCYTSRPRWQLTFGGFARWRQRGFFNASNRRENTLILSTRDNAAILQNRSLGEGDFHVIYFIFTFFCKQVLSKMQKKLSFSVILSANATPLTD
jgi:hypothetical protein